MTGSLSESEMTAHDVCGFLDLMDPYGTRVWLDGGWAVDPALAPQSRRHGDLDIVIEERDVPVAVAVLQSRQYAPCPVPTPAHGTPS